MDKKMLNEDLQALNANVENARRANASLTTMKGEDAFVVQLTNVCRKALEHAEMMSQNIAKREEDSGSVDDGTLIYLSKVLAGDLRQMHTVRGATKKMGKRLLPLAMMLAADVCDVLEKTLVLLQASMGGLDKKAAASSVSAKQLERLNALEVARSENGENVVEWLRHKETLNSANDVKLVERVISVLKKHERGLDAIQLELREGGVLK